MHSPQLPWLHVFFLSANPTKLSLNYLLMMVCFAVPSLSPPHPSPLSFQVVISLKSGNGGGFLYSTTCSTSNENLIEDLCRIHNDRLRIGLLAHGVRELGKHGVMKKNVSAPVMLLAR